MDARAERADHGRACISRAFRIVITPRATPRTAMSVSMIGVKRALQFTSATGIAYGLRFVPQLPRACANRIESIARIALHRRHDSKRTAG